MRSDLQAVFVYVMFQPNVFEPLGEFDSFEGGSWSVDGKMYYPPGSSFPVNRGGKAEIDEATVTREWQPQRDHPLYRRLKDLPNARIRATRHDREGTSVNLTPFAVFEGLLSGLSAPDYDSQSADDSVLSLLIAPSGAIG